MVHRRRHRTLVSLVAAMLVAGGAAAAPLWNVPVAVRQPDGSLLACLASGDEFHNWLHDAANYTILQDPGTGWFVYATVAKGALGPSSLVPGRDDPRAAGLQPGLNIAPEEMARKRADFLAATPVPLGLAPKKGTINNVVIFIRFSEEAEYADSAVIYSRMFNDATVGANSMYNYFREVSYTKLTVSSTFYPAAAGAITVSYQDTAKRGFFQPYNSTSNPIGYQGGDNGSERTSREHGLLKRAVDAVASQVPAGLAIDSDNNGQVDNVCFVVSGAPTGWASLLWPHRWSLYSVDARINGKRVYDYNFQLQNSLKPRNVGVLCHEMFHSVGSPDLYHYTGNGIAPVYRWDVMENNANPPQHMLAFMKWRYGQWIDSIRTISTPGTYTLNPLTSATGNCYRIPSPKSTTEYFVVEYRKKSAPFENSVPGEGLIVYRINKARDGMGNASGPPDEVYVYRPNGTLTANGTPASAHFSSGAGRTFINDASNPSSFLSTGLPGGLALSDIGAAGSTISFSLDPPLPVQLAAFRAWRLAPARVRLEWATLSERNNYGFVVERSVASAGPFDSTGFAGGKGTSTDSVAYAFTDSAATGFQYYRLRQIDLDGTEHVTAAIQPTAPTGVEREALPLQASLAQNYPNPFNPTTAIRFGVPGPGSREVLLAVYDVLGREVALLVDGAVPPGSHEVTFDARGLASGVYLYRLTVRPGEAGGETRLARRLLLLR